MMMHSCKNCGVTFARKSNLTRHINGRCKSSGLIVGPSTLLDPPHISNVCRETVQRRNKVLANRKRLNEIEHLQDEESSNNKQTKYQKLPATNGDKIATYPWCISHNGESGGGSSSDESMSNAESPNESDEDITTYTWRDDDDDGSITKNHSIFLPRDVRAIIVGKSGSGKTTLLNSLLLKPDVMDYDKLMVCGKSLHQPGYRIMQLGFGKGLSKNQVRKLFKKQKYVSKCGGIDEVLSGVTKCKGGVDASFFDDVTMIPDPSEHDPSQRNLLVLDDVMLSPQNKVEAYFTRGRHNNVDVIYITQSYFRLPRQTIRENGNLFIFFQQDRKNLTHIFNDHCSGDGIPFQTFCDFCNAVWREDKHNFVTIDLTRTVDNGKYRKNLKDGWLPYKQLLQK